MRVFVADIQTPVGTARASATDAGIFSLILDDWHSGQEDDHPHLRALRLELDAYFRREPTVFTVPVALNVGTPFQRRVWDYLRSIPFGQTRTYGRQATDLGNPAATRAVGRANGCNPVWLLVPCHRVIGASGNLTGYAGGVHRKRWLLDHEAADSLLSSRTPAHLHV